MANYAIARAGIQNTKSDVGGPVPARGLPTRLQRASYQRRKSPGRTSGTGCSFYPRRHSKAPATPSASSSAQSAGWSLNPTSTRGQPDRPWECGKGVDPDVGYDDGGGLGSAAPKLFPPMPGDLAKWGETLRQASHGPPQDTRPLAALRRALPFFSEERLCCTNRLTAGRPLLPVRPSHDLCDGYAERCVAVQHGNTNLELRQLTIEVPRHEALAQ